MRNRPTGNDTRDRNAEAERQSQHYVWDDHHVTARDYHSARSATVYLAFVLVLSVVVQLALGDALHW